MVNDPFIIKRETKNYIGFLPGLDVHEIGQRRADGCALQRHLVHALHRQCAPVGPVKVLIHHRDAVRMRKTGQHLPTVLTC